LEQGAEGDRLLPERPIHTVNASRPKIFLLGVGAHKSGTTWLYDYLRRHPNAAMGFTKEYHVFDALYIGAEDIRRKFLQARINRVLHAATPPNPADLTLLRFLGDPESYFGYFQHLVHKTPGILVTGDITPTYSSLPEEGFRHIRNGVTGRGFSIRVVFSMRDPVERCISAARFDLRNAGVMRTPETEIRHLGESFLSERYQIRSRYDQTLRNLEKVFAPDQVHCLFYEELFCEESLRKICDFLPIPYIGTDFTHRVNESRTAHEIPLELRTAIARFYRPVYDAVMQRFGPERIKSLWPSCALLDQAP
jgi:Sulfotransferase domain